MFRICLVLPQQRGAQLLIATLLRGTLPTCFREGPLFCVKAGGDGEWYTCVVLPWALEAGSSGEACLPFGLVPPATGMRS